MTSPNKMEVWGQSNGNGGEWGVTFSRDETTTGCTFGRGLPPDRVKGTLAPRRGAQVEGNFLPGLGFFRNSFLRSGCDLKEARV